MEKKIKIGINKLTLEGIYPFRYDYGKGKEVLRIEIIEPNHNFDEVKILENTDNQNIEYWEDEEKKNEYTGYCKDFSCNYTDGKYSIEVTRLSETDRKIEQMQEVLDYLVMQ